MHDLTLPSLSNCQVREQHDGLHVIDALMIFRDSIRGAPTSSVCMHTLGIQTAQRRSHLYIHIYIYIDRQSIGINSLGALGLETLVSYDVSLVLLSICI